MTTVDRADTLVVLMGDEPAGRLVRHEGGPLSFVYDRSYPGSADATPLSMTMPLGSETFPDEVVTPWLWGLLPDNESVVTRWAKHYRVSAWSPFSLLGTPVGEDCAGAVRFVPESRLEAALARPGRVRWLDAAAIAARLVELRDDRDSWLGKDFSGQFSLAGAQAKIALIADGDRWGLPSGRRPTTHIVKPAVAGFEHQDLNEHVCLDAARRVGLIAAKSRVMRFDEESAIVVERFDRRRVARQTVRVHQEDLCQALGLGPTLKYQADGGPSPGDAAALFHRVMPWETANHAVWRLGEALAWNWLIGGTDAHAKNYSLLMAGDQVRLAPLYDVTSMLPYGHHEKKLRFAMKLGGSYLVDVARNPWPKVAAELGLDSGVLVDRVRDLARQAADALADAVAEADMSEASNFTHRLIGLVADRAKRCEGVLKSRGRT